MSAKHTGVRGQYEQSVIFSQIFAQARNSEVGIAGLDLQEQLRRCQLIREVESGRGDRIADQLKIFIDLSAFFLHRLELGFLHRNAVHQLLSKHFRAAR
jgi:hypothetical protein